MTCPVCGGKTKVVDSRAQDCESVWRRRKCLVCKKTFHTVELETETVEELIRRANEKLL